MSDPQTPSPKPLAQTPVLDPANPAAVRRCLFCGQPEQLIWVHGHGQCAHCGVNAMPCCDGAECDIDPR